MPISKEGNLYYKQEQYDIARYQSSALEYAISQGYDLVKKGKFYHWKEHDSCVFKDDGSFHWNSQGHKGGAIEFLTQVEHKALTEAVLILAGEDIHTQEISKPKYMTKEPIEDKNSPSALFSLPEKAPNYRRAFAYLTKTRCLDGDILVKLLDNKKFYESATNHNIIFPFTNGKGEIVGAFQKGTYTEKPFSGMVVNSNRKEGYFCFGGSEKADTVCIFEAAIDAISYADLLKRAGRSDYYEGKYYLAVGGNGDQNVDEFLSHHPKIKRVVLCHDNDASGHKMAEVLGKRLSVIDYEVVRSVPKMEQGDFNADLQNLVTQELAQFPSEGARACYRHCWSIKRRNCNVR